MSAPALLSDDLNALKGEGGGYRLKGGSGKHDRHPNTSDWHGRFQPVPDESNDYQLNREAMRQGNSYVGLPSVTIEDATVTESMGRLYSRGSEHLGTTDAMIIRTRRRLIEAAEALDQEGKAPPGVEDPTVYRVRSGGLMLAKDADWFEATGEARRAFVDNSAEAIRASVTP